MSSNYTVIQDDKFVTSGNRAHCIAMAKSLRAALRRAGHNPTGRVEVRNARGVKVA